MTESSNKKQKMADIQENNKDNINDSGPTIVKTPRHLENLPNEIVDLIIVYVSDERQSKQSLQNDLYQCSLINKQFYHQTNRLLWHTPVISNADTLDRFITGLTNTQIIQQTTNPSNSITMKSTISHPHNNKILTARHHIRQLDIKDDYWDNMRFLLVIHFVDLLEILTIDDHATSKVTDTSLRSLPRYCPRITTIAFVPSSSYTERFIDSIIQNFQHLGQIELNLTFNNLHPDIFKSFLNCPSLTTLILKGNNMERHANTSFLSTSMVMDMMVLNRLKELAFIGRGISSTLRKVFTTIPHDTHPWPLLSSLRVEFGGLALNDTMMIPFIESHPHLERLFLAGSHISDTTLNKIATHLPGLTHLTLVINYKITKDGVYSLVRHCHDLKQAYFPGCFRLLHSMVEFEFPRLQRGLTITEMDKIRQLDW